MKASKIPNILAKETTIKVLPFVAGFLFSFSFASWGSGIGSVLAVSALLHFHREARKYPAIARHYLAYLYASFLLFNTISCGWICNASIFGGLSEIIINSAFMSVPWIIHKKAADHKNNGFAKLMLITSWLAFEYIHTYWELQWPWLSLGNAFATETMLVQWYEFTGVLGGTAWIMLLACSLDAVLFRIRSREMHRGLRSELVIFSFLVFAPITVSATLYAQETTKEGNNATVVVQPNFDAYSHSGLSPKQQVAKLLRLTKQSIGAETNTVLWPEVSISTVLDENHLQSHRLLQPVLAQSKTLPATDYIIGISTYKTYSTQASQTARKLPRRDGYYDAFNTLLHIRNGNIVALRHKSKLVIGVEKIPFPGVLNYFARFIASLGGSAGSLGSDTTLTPFTLADSASINSLICYESVFGHYACSNLPSLITIHTNDGWWGDTQGHAQHFSFARLRAIENRSYVARSAYCGISGFITPKGAVMATIPYQTEGAISAPVGYSGHTTFYQENGDFIGRWATFFSALLLLYLFVSVKTGKA